MIRKLWEFVWPAMGKSDDPELGNDCESIESANWKEDADDILEEVRRLRDVETERSRAASNNSQFYIGGLLAFIPIVLALLDADYVKDRLSSWEPTEVLAFAFFGLSGIHGCAAFWNASQVKKVRAYHRVDTRDLVALAGPRSLKTRLIKQILLSVRHDRVAVNEQVGYVRAAQMHVTRMAAFFLLSLILFLMASQFFDLLGVLYSVLRSWAHALKSWICGFLE